MEVFIVVAAVAVGVITLLWWVNRRNPGTFGSRDVHASEDHSTERKNWGPR
jgi:hypothetical protein